MRNAHAKKIQRSSGKAFVLISKDSMDELELRPQDPNCLLVEIPDKPRNRLVYKVVKLDT